MFQIPMDSLKRIFYFLLIASIFPSAIKAADIQRVDTIRLDEVIVTGSMPKVNLRTLPMSISVVGERQIEEKDAKFSVAIIDGRSTRAFITQRGVAGYGVASGAAGAMSIRGIGGAPSTGVLVLIEPRLYRTRRTDFHRDSAETFTAVAVGHRPHCRSIL